MQRLVYTVVARVCFPGVKRSSGEDYYLPQSRVQAKNTWSYTSALICTLKAPCLIKCRKNFKFYSIMFTCLQHYLESEPYEYVLHVIQNLNLGWGLIPLFIVFRYGWNTTMRCVDITVFVDWTSRHMFQFLAAITTTSSSSKLAVILLREGYPPIQIISVRNFVIVYGPDPQIQHECYLRW
jgi:hypothetical protein